MLASCEPGCLRLRVDRALRPVDGRRESAEDGRGKLPDGSPSAGQRLQLEGDDEVRTLAQALLDGPAGAFFSANAFSVARGGAAVRYEPPQTRRGNDALRAVEVPPALARLPPIAPVAVDSTRRVVLRFTGPEAQATWSAGWAPACIARFHGSRLAPSRLVRAASPRCAVLLPTGLEGVMLFEPARGNPTDPADPTAVVADAFGGAPFGGALPLPRPVLLTRSAALASELSCLPAGSRATESFVRALGFCLQPNAPVALLAAVAADAAGRGLLTTLLALLPRLRAAALQAGEEAAAAAEPDESAGPLKVADHARSAALLPDRATTLLHAAAAGGSAACCAAVAAAGGAESLFGGPQSRGIKGITPLHAAAFSPAAAAQLLRQGGAAARAAWTVRSSAAGQMEPPAICAAAAEALLATSPTRRREMQVLMLSSLRSVVVEVLFLTCCILRAQKPVPSLQEVALLQPRLPWDVWIDLRVTATWPEFIVLRHVAELVFWAALAAWGCGRINASIFTGVYAWRCFWHGVLEPMLNAWYTNAAYGTALGPPIAPWQHGPSEMVITVFMGTLSSPIPRVGSAVLLARALLPFAKPLVSSGLWFTTEPAAWHIVNTMIAVGFIAARVAGARKLAVTLAAEQTYAAKKWRLRVFTGTVFSDGDPTAQGNLVRTKLD